MKMLKISFGVVATFSFLGMAAGQVFTFENLNFESARNLGTPPSSSESAANAFPFWTVTAPSAVCYDNYSLSGGSVSIIDTNANSSGLEFSTIQGKYFCLLEGLNGPPFFGGMGPTSIAQTGYVPATAKSITFWGSDHNLQISFAGNSLTFIPVGTGANYTIYGADISAYAGQTGLLEFDAPAGLSDSYADGAGAGEIDNIQFSSQPVTFPELTIVYTNQEIIVSWPATFPAGDPNWTLQTSTNLTGGSWVNYGGTVVNNSVTNPPAAGNLFFRLTYP